MEKRLSNNEEGGLLSSLLIPCSQTPRLEISIRISTTCFSQGIICVSVSITGFDFHVLLLKSIYELISSTYRLLHYTFMNSLRGKYEQVTSLQIYGMGTEHISFVCTYCITNVQLKVVSTRHLTEIFILRRLTNDCRISLLFQISANRFYEFKQNKIKIVQQVKVLSCTVRSTNYNILSIHKFSVLLNLFIVKILGLN